MSLWSNHYQSKSLIDPSDMLHLISGTSFLHHSVFLWSESFIPLSATFIWTCQFNLLHSAIIFHYFFTVSLWAQNLPFQKILSSTVVCFCLSDCWGSKPFTGLTCSSVLCFIFIVSFCLCLCTADKVGQLSGRLVCAQYWLIDCSNCTCMKSRTEPYRNVLATFIHMQLFIFIDLV